MKLPTFLMVGFLLSALVRGGEMPRVEPAAVGLSPQLAEKVSEALQRLVDDRKIPGAVVAVARRGRVAVLTAVGLRDRERGDPMTEDTIFAIASMTKPVTCVAAMTLVERGQIGLDDPVARFLPELGDPRVLEPSRPGESEDLVTVPARRPITVRDLLTHTSGYTYGGLLTPDFRLTRLYAEAKVQDRGLETIAEQVARLGRVPLAHHPGERWTYGLSHDVLGRLIEVVSGMSFDRYLEEAICQPLDLRDTSFHVPESKRHRMATIYRGGTAPELSPLPRTFGSTTFFAGGGGLFSTARDYLRFAQMLLNGGELEGVRILRPETVAAMTSNQIGDQWALGQKYGLGLGLEFEPDPAAGKPVVSRFFWGGFFSTRFWAEPRNELVGVYLTQVLPTDHGGGSVLIRKLVSEAVEDRGTRPNQDGGDPGAGEDAAEGAR